MGSSKQPEPQAPVAPTQVQSAEDFAKAYPIYYENSLKYNPLLAQQEKDINAQLYPETSGLQETIAGQANKALKEDLPAWYENQVKENLKSQLGRNLVWNPLAQEQYGVASQQAYQGYGDYWRNLSLSAAGRQPLAASPNIMQTYTPAASMNFAQQGYGTGANVYGTQMQNYTSQSQYNPWANVGGSIAGGIAGGMTGGMFGYGGKFGQAVK